MIEGKTLLFQGSPATPEDGRSSPFCRALARHVVDEKCLLVFGGFTELEFLMAEEVRERCEALSVSSRDHLAWYTSGTDIDDERMRVGRHYQLNDLFTFGSHGSLRTYLVELSDALITIGGGKGVADSVEKARLIGKPFFPIPLGGGESEVLWKQFVTGELPFCSRDAFEQLGDQNLPVDETVGLVFEQLRTWWSPRQARVFIVHGHDGSLKYELKDFIQNTLGLGEPVILQDLPSGGKTIIEKLEEYADTANLVFVLLTPDDKVVTGGEPSESSWRSRQNVILELGYFLGRLGRRSGQVLLLYKGTLELPSDISGIASISIDGGIETAGEAIRRELAGWLR
jgi:Predicted nucleotide-binding protein containing TIR-like domain